MVVNSMNKELGSCGALDSTAASIVILKNNFVHLHTMCSVDVSLKSRYVR